MGKISGAEISSQIADSVYASTCLDVYLATENAHNHF
jgi:hypothetical protein